MQSGGRAAAVQSGGVIAAVQSGAIVADVQSGGTAAAVCMRAAAAPPPSPVHDPSHCAWHWAESAETVPMRAGERHGEPMGGGAWGWVGVGWAGGGRLGRGVGRVWVGCG